MVLNIQAFDARIAKMIENASEKWERESFVSNNMLYIAIYNTSK